jgi:hypothetical protein
MDFDHDFAIYAQFSMGYTGGGRASALGLR